MKKARTLVGEILWGVGRCGPDLTAACNRLATTSSKPTKLWWAEAKCYISYLAQRSKLKPCLRYWKRHKGDPIFPRFVAFADSSFNCTRSNRSLMGYQVYYGTSLILWRIGLTRSVVLSIHRHSLFDYNDLNSCT